MVTAINSFIIPDDVVNKMRIKIKETREKMIEHGFGLCRIGKSNIIRPGVDCTGTECVLTEPRGCIIGSYIGGYHTHPTTGTKPSITDLAAAYNQNIECIGSVKEDSIKCVTRVGPIVPRIRQEISDAIKNVEEALPPIVTNEELYKWESTRDNLIMRHFKIIDVK